MIDETTIRKQLDERFANLEFYEKRHIYYWKGIRVPYSVSGLIKKFEEPFDEKLWLPRCAKKEGVTEQELKQRWVDKNKLACKRGTETHSFLEYYDGIQIPKTPTEIAGVKYLRGLGKRYKIIKRELRVYSEEYDFAGTLDLPLWDMETQSIVIDDYKTNEDLFRTFGMLKDPFSMFPSNPYNKYQIQLSYYQMALEEAGFKVSDRRIIYLTDQEEYTIYNTGDFTQALRNYHKQVA